MNPSFQTSADTKVLRSALSEVAVGSQISYEALSKAIGRDVRKFARGALNTALRQMFTDEGVVFACVRNVGYQRLGGDEIVDSSEADRKKIMRASKKAVRKLAHVDFAGLSEEKKRQHTVSAAQLGAIQMFASKGTEKRIANTVKETGKQNLAIGETLKLFGG